MQVSPTPPKNIFIPIGSGLYTAVLHKPQNKKVLLYFLKGKINNEL